MDKPHNITVIEAFKIALLVAVIVGLMIPSLSSISSPTNPINRWLFSVSGKTYSVIKPSTGQTSSNTNPTTLINFVIGKAGDEDILDFQGTIMKFTSGLNPIIGAKSLTWKNGNFWTVNSGSAGSSFQFTGPGDGLTTMTMKDFIFNVTSIVSCGTSCSAQFFQASFQNPTFENIKLISTGILGQAQFRFFLDSTDVNPRINGFTALGICFNVLQDAVLQSITTTTIRDVDIESCNDGASTAIRLFAQTQFEAAFVLGFNVGLWLDSPVIVNGLTCSALSVATCVKETVGLATQVKITNSFFNGQTLTLNSDTLLIGDDNQPKGPIAVIVGASPFTYTDSDNVLESVYLRGGAITTVTKNGVTLFGALAAGSPLTVDMYPAQSIIITYTVIPSMTADRF